jgi:hypothetical protein
MSIWPEPLPVICATDADPVAPAEPAGDKPADVAGALLEVTGGSDVAVLLVEEEPQATSKTAAIPAAAPAMARRRKVLGDMTFPSGASAVVGK